MSTTVRRGLASDAASLAAIRAALSALEPGRAEGTPQSPQLGAAYFARLIDEHSGLLYVAEAHGAVVGYLAMQRAGHPAVAARSPVQLWQLYVSPAFHGAGIAALLVSAALDHARRHQHDVMWLGVSEHNRRAIAFYGKHGFAALGVHEVGGDGHAHQDLLMSRLVH